MTIGLTGGIGSGKSTVARALESMGHPVFYSDQAAKEIMSSDKSLQKDIIAHFGEEAYVNGVLNRAYLAERIFSNPDDKEVLNGMIHPRVRSAFAQFAQSAQSRLVFNEAAILFETDGHVNFDKMILVTAPVETRIERVMKRDGSSAEQVRDRMKNQWTDEQKIPLADFVIKNGDTDRVLEQIEAIEQTLLDYSTSS